MEVEDKYGQQFRRLGDLEKFAGSSKADADRKAGSASPGGHGQGVSMAWKRLSMNLHFGRD